MERSIKGNGTADQLVPWIGKSPAPVVGDIWCLYQRHMSGTRCRSGLGDDGGRTERLKRLGDGETERLGDDGDDWDESPVPERSGTLSGAEGPRGGCPIRNLPPS